VAVWRHISAYYRSIEFQDANGALVLRLGHVGGEAGPGDGPPPGGGWLAAAALLDQPVLEQPILDQRTGTLLGTVVAAPRLSELLPSEVISTGFGSAGYNLVLDRETGSVVHYSRGDQPVRAAAPDPEGLGFEPDAVLTSEAGGRFRFMQADSTRLAAFVSLDAPPWTVVSVAALEEFSGPFQRMRALNLALVLLVIIAVSLASLFLVRRATRSLEELTTAAGDVAQGRFLPVLPSPGSDEVGRLSAAFGTMVDRIREMMAQLQASRQMAAVGEFAAELAHEIRNPLTSIKLNLQRIDRAVAEGGSPETAAPVAIALREVGRLERVVTGVLRLGRPRPLERGLVSLHAVANDAMDTIRTEAEASGVRLVHELAADRDTVLGDPDQLRGALLNLLLNSVEAMPHGGELTLTTAVRGPTVELVVRDSGPGIPAHVRPNLFRPFFTTKAEGTGLGLAVAMRAAEEHGGSLELLEGEDRDAVFRLLLPLVATPAPVGG